MIIFSQLGQDAIPKDFESKQLWLEESGLDGEFLPGNEGFNLITELKNKVNTYNLLIKESEKQIPINNTLTKMTESQVMGYSNYNLLSHLSQIQLFVLQNEM
jgi:hypothetical protein